MVENSSGKKVNGIPQPFSIKHTGWSRSKFLRLMLPVLGGIMIGLLTALIMRFVGGNLGF